LSHISSKEDAELAVQKLITDFQCNNVIITLGSEGAILWDKSVQRNFYIPATQVNAVDTTGAGDCFIGTLAFCIARGNDLPTALKQAVANASDSVRRKGTQFSFPYGLIQYSIKNKK
jgi:ribokinase